MIFSRIPFLFALVSLTLLAAYGCALAGPDFKLPAAPVAATWQEANDPRVMKGTPDFRDWWHVFQDPVLDRLIDRAYAENLQLRAIALRVIEVRAQLGITVGALYPQTQQGLGYWQYNRISASSPQAPLTGGNQRYRQVEIGLSVGWKLDFWGKFRRAVESARAAWLTSVADYDNALISLTADVASAYTLLRTLDKRLDIARRNVEAQLETVKITEARVRYGVTTQLDLEQAQTVLNNTQASIPSLEAQERQARNALSLLLGQATR